MISLVKLGSKEDAKLLEPFLNDKTLVTQIAFGMAGGGVQKTEVQVRDVALGVTIKLAGQKPSDFGYDPSRSDFLMEYSHMYYGFPDDAQREATHKKWKEFLEKKAADKK